jgi:CheY-like chemotaxis protein
MAGDAVAVKILPAPGLCLVKADAGQIEQVIINLALNAHDAMPNGGKLMMETANVSIDQESVGRYPDLKPGDYVMLAITDTGAGMRPEVKARAFEPFFTTKGVGEGSGLGLSTCYGIIKQSGGHITAWSKVGGGSSFKIYLPAISEPAGVEKPAATAPKKLVPGRGTILLVEDEEAVRLFTERVLFDAGYHVLTAGDGEEALRIAEIFLDRIDLILTDVVMPRMSGRVMAETLCRRKPRLKVLYMSGYTDDAILRHGVLTAESAFLQKPFSAVGLSEKIHAVLAA